MFNKQVLIPVTNTINSFVENNVLCIDDHYYSYNDFAKTVSKIRIALQSEEIKGKNIGLICHYDIETYASIFAIWMEGGAYVPVEPQQPCERNVEIFNQSDVSLILNSGNEQFFPSRRCINTSGLKFTKLALSLDAFSDDLCAIILFTSGSTGKPKGVSISRGNIASYVDAFWNEAFLINENDRFIQISSFTFDASIIEYLLPIIKGGCIYPVPNTHLRYVYIREVLETYSLTVIFIIPSILKVLIPYFNNLSFPALRYVMIGGEAVSSGLVKYWSPRIPNAIIYIGYGPTENTVFSSFYKYNRNGDNKSYKGILSIGKPMKGNLMIILDSTNHELSSGYKGELCISSSQLTKGYIADDSLNKKSFFIDKQGRRFYRTGDLCYKDEEGDILFCGRVDLQVKIQGIRIELEEIEFLAYQVIKTSNVIALTYNNVQGVDEIALIIEQKDNINQDILDQLKNRIPAYMMPSKIIFFPRFPLNSNGKIDRIALKKLLI